MCGRYSQSTDLAELVKRFGIKQPPFHFTPSYNIAPGASTPVITPAGLRLLKWGFVPAWSGGPFRAGPAMPLFPAGSSPLERKYSGEETSPEAQPETEPEGFINARAEGIASRPAFRAAFYNSRCIIPADGFYEWSGSAGEKIPYRFSMRDGALFGMAGVYEEKRGTFAIITAAASALVRAVHHRMPVILEPRHEALWLNPRMRDSETLLPLLRAYDSSLMRGYRVSDIVNDPKHDSPDCAKPLD
ncbi:MAG TPA: SOS response-associated peptidase [Elusimicrobia bacterium]|jgi:putative SOS response-associated peptidase YedK|nr:SOS response-associated peptidase [Elusimicrobiota bacterium]